MSERAKAEGKGRGSEKECVAIRGEREWASECI